MKNVFLALFLFISLTALAQEKKERRPQGDKLTKEQKVDFQVKRMTKDLNLDEKQAKEVRAIVTKEVEKREAKRAEVKEQQAKKKEEMKAKMKEEQAAVAAEMKKVLTAEQYAKWEKLREERKENRQEKMSERMGKRKLKDHPEDN